MVKGEYAKHKGSKIGLPGRGFSPGRVASRRQVTYRREWSQQNRPVDRNACLSRIEGGIY